MIPLLWLGGCLLPTPSSRVDVEVCELEATLSPSSAEVGALVTLSGRPFTAPGDTVVRVGGVQATVSAVDRLGCEACDLCVADTSDCRCATCSACDAACAECVETVVFAVPRVASGPQSVVMINRYGASESVILEVEARATDTDTDTDVDTDTDTDVVLDTDTDSDTL